MVHGGTCRAADGGLAPERGLGGVRAILVDPFGEGDSS